MKVDIENSGSGQNSQQLRVTNLRYGVEAGGGTIPVLDDICFGVEAGEIVAIVGPSGCGKSTLIHLIAGFLKADSGQILLDEKEVTEPSTRQGVMFQDLGLLPWRTVRGNIQFGIEAENLSRSALDERVSKLIASVGLADFGHFYPHELSGGMAQRVALARTLAPAPRILLMDEPFRSLDAQTRLMMQEELLQLWEEDRRMILFVTHDVDEAVFLASRIIVLTARPATVKEVFDVPLPRPRTAVTRYRSAYLTIRNHVLSSVSEETEIAAWVIKHAANRPPNELWIGYVDTLAESLPLHVTQRRGFFADQHVTVRLWPFKNGLKIASLVAEGHLQGGSVGPIAFLHALDKGAEVSTVEAGAALASDDDLYAAICVKRGSELQQVADLKGKRVAVNGFQTMGYALIQKSLDNEQLFNSLEIIPLSFAEMIPALDHGAVDAVMLFEPFISPGLSKGQITVLCDTGRSLTGAWLSITFLQKPGSEEHAAQIDRFGASFRDALGLIARDPVDAKRVLAKVTGDSEDALSSLKLPVWTGTPDISAIRLLVEPLARRGFIAKPDAVVARLADIRASGSTSD